MTQYVCSECGAAAYHDGRCGDGPVLMCGCDRRRKNRGQPTEAPQSAEPEPDDFDYADRH